MAPVDSVRRVISFAGRAKRSVPTPAEPGGRPPCPRGCLRWARGACRQGGRRRDPLAVPALRCFQANLHVLAVRKRERIGKSIMGAGAVRIIVDLVSLAYHEQSPVA